MGEVEEVVEVGGLEGVGWSWDWDWGRERREVGREEEKSGLSVKRLWIRMLRCGRVPTPGLGEEEDLVSERATAWGEVIKAEEVGGRRARVSRASWRFDLWLLIAGGRSLQLERLWFEGSCPVVCRSGCKFSPVSTFVLSPVSLCFCSSFSRSLLISLYSCSRLMKTCARFEGSEGGIPP